MRQWRNDSREPRRSWRAPSGCSPSRTQPTSRRASRRCSARCTCSSMKGITGRHPNLPCARSSVRTRCVWRPCCVTTHSAQRPRPSRWARSCASTRRAYLAGSRPATSACWVIRIDRNGTRRSWPTESGLLDQSAFGPALSTYHVEAAIAWVHASAHRVDETDWRTIVSLYGH